MCSRLGQDKVVGGRREFGKVGQRGKGRRDGGGKVVYSWWQGMMWVHAGIYGSFRVYAINT